MTLEEFFDLSQLIIVSNLDGSIATPSMRYYMTSEFHFGHPEFPLAKYGKSFFSCHTNKAIVKCSSSSRGVWEYIRILSIQITTNESAKVGISDSCNP